MKRKQINIKFTDSALDLMVYDYLKSRPSLIEWLRLTVLKEVQKVSAASVYGVSVTRGEENGKKD